MLFAIDERIAACSREAAGEASKGSIPEGTVEDFLEKLFLARERLGVSGLGSTLSLLFLGQTD